MTKEQALSATVSLLTHVYESDINSVATIINADAEARMGNKEGIDTLVEALESVKDFIGNLIIKIQEDDRKTEESSSHYQSNASKQ